MKLHRVNASRKEHICAKCRETIEIGEKYIWWHPYKQNIVRWHMWHGEPPRSMLTTSEKQRQVYGAQEAILDYLQDLLVMAIDDNTEPKELEKQTTKGKEIIDSNLDKAQEISCQYLESAQAVKDRFGVTPVVKDCETKANWIAGWVLEVHDISMAWDERINGLFERSSWNSVQKNILIHFVRKIIDEVERLEL